MDVAIDAGDLIRAAHLAASVLPAGLYVFMLLIAGPIAYAANDAGVVPTDLRAWTARALRWSLPVAFLTGLLWLGLEAASMSGQPLRDAITPDVLGKVLGSTLFGHLWIGRAAVLAALAAWVARPVRTQKGVLGDTVGLVLAGAFVVSLAWVGHAAGVEGAEGAALLASQVLHLGAAAGWLGGLPPLGVTLALSRGRPGTLGFAAAVTRRFSLLGVVCVAVLVLSGIVNSWVLVGTIPGLLGTPYGQILLIKLALVAGMVALAAVNRFWLTPAFDREPRRAVRILERTVTIETALGIGVLVAVGALGAAAPAAHEEPLWPLDFTLSLERILLGGRLDPHVEIALAVAAAGVLALVIGAVYRTRIVGGLGVLAILGAADFIGLAMVVPAYPTSYMTSPVGFTAEAVAQGAGIYAAHCAACHGPTGRGDGPAAAGFPPGEATVVGHLLDHSPGELFWFIGNGIPETPMPGFSAAIPPDQRWRLIQFLRAEAQATAVRAMTSRVSPAVGAPAPDFSFQVDDRPAETLAAQRGKAPVLLVLYSRPTSDARLAQLAAAARGLPQLRIVAVPLDGDDPAADYPDDPGVTARAAAAVVEAYALYGWKIAPSGAQGKRHTEFLIDRSGNLRARWHLDDADGWADLARLKTQLDELAREPFRPAEPARHVHR